VKTKQLAAYGWVVATALALAACKKDPGERSAEAVEEAGYELSAEAYFRAAASDDLKALRGMRAAGLGLETADGRGRTALHAAAGSGAIRAVDFLLDEGLKVDVADDVGKTPLMEAVIRSSPEMVRHLLAQGADPRAKDSENYKPLMLAVREGREEMVRELAPYVRQDLDDALLAAAILGQPEVIDELTNYGASVYARYDDGRTPLMLAAEYGREEAVEMLLGIGANRFGMDDRGRTAAELAAAAGHESLARRLEDRPRAGDFELDEPAELGAEMLARVAQDDDAPPRPTAGGGDSGNGSDSPDSGESAASGGTSARGAVAPLEGAVVGTLPPEPTDGRSAAGAETEREPAGSPGTGATAARPDGAGDSQVADTGEADPGPTDTRNPAATSDDAAPAHEVTEARPGGGTTAGRSAKPAGPPVVMRAYREKELPLRLESTTEDRARIKVAGGETVEVAKGATIPGSRLKLVKIERRMRSGKERGGALDEVSVVTLEDEASGVAREITVGLPALAHDPVALVEDAAGGRHYVARTGQRFRAADGTEYVVGDVRPSQMVIENAETGETTTLSLRGPRG
jgi:ankyrin repeat protein